MFDSWSAFAIAMFISMSMLMVMALIAFVIFHFA
jgi:hypothetical protein